MPELPEVETICRQLSQEVTGRRIVGVDVKDKRVIKEITVKKLRTVVCGKTIRSVTRRGKMIICGLSGEYYLLIHLRISGWLILDESPQPCVRVLFRLPDGRSIQFCDSRVLGEIRLVRQLGTVRFLERMGPEPLTLSEKKFIRLFEGKTAKIKPLLMDQFFIAGLGNIYAQEALFCAGIHPERHVHMITKEELGNLYRCLRKILRKAIKKCGTSTDTYTQPDGAQGEFVRFLCVYQRQGEPCRRCQNEIVKKTVGGRGTCFCPVCQN
ncbi:MAG: bifunctional DNA-formamidopyrimidine glycosylase/DNA-(apurinic or apyrimidinic site) lyase [Candidatus Omnitrophica bacterium]|nr:bifunctional DNA-formamidopyrimidine glycosylase/DNA-(apurinic or apyrimidinic site) lyase [Candidatus Omnitrophota bacterium]